jgi:voltage-dependent potassium channel beta subunit
MEYRFLGNSGLHVSTLSLGGWITFGDQIDESITLECMKTAYEHGINYFDTAEAYANGQSEIVMGNVIKRCGWKRSSLVISTKIFLGGKGPNDIGLSRKHVIEGLKACLKRLQLEYVDIVFAHRPDTTTPMEEVVRAFNHVIDKGWAFYWGTSEWSAEQISEAWGIANRLGLIGPLCEQPQYNMLHRERFEKEYAPLYKKYGMGTTIWSPLAGGVLTGKYNQGIPEGSRLSSTTNALLIRQREMLSTPEGKEKLTKVAKLMEIAKRLECTVSQLALAWCIHNTKVSTLIMGASKPSQVLENLKSIEIKNKLTEADMKEMDAVLNNAPTPDMQFRT